jgi:hypothetical protein
VVALYAKDWGNVALLLVAIDSAGAFEKSYDKS